MFPERRSLWQKATSYSTSRARARTPELESMSCWPCSFLEDGIVASRFRASAKISWRCRSSNRAAFSEPGGNLTIPACTIHSASCSQTRGREESPAASGESRCISANLTAVFPTKSTGSVWSISTASMGRRPTSQPSIRPLPKRPHRAGPNPDAASSRKIAFSLCLSHARSPALPKIRTSTGSNPSGVTRNNKLVMPPCTCTTSQE
mmetsp:Transcript_27779/g.73365  ORF Transcript_27779/g.73365 Transcript_27779/m.73365 type:complete len:206 (-) Transcript_27779:161-778(-)